MSALEEAEAIATELRSKITAGDKSFAVAISLQSIEKHIRLLEGKLVYYYREDVTGGESVRLCADCGEGFDDDGRIRPHWKTAILGQGIGVIGACIICDQLISDGPQSGGER